MKRFLLVLAAALCLFSPVRADEGMWLPSLIANRIPDMQSKGFKLTAEDVYSINQASMKDAIVRFGRGCTGELVSPDGLLLTNHHCGYRQIQSHSTVEHDYLTNGFWAMNRSEELPNEGLTVTFLVRMEDVTEKVLKGIKSSASEEERNKIIKENSDKIKTAATKGTHYTAAVEPFYSGNQYFLFVNEIYEDVRLVGAPPSSIGKFGGDTDNWMWPRHTGDFSVFRVYADKNNNPAPYSKDNVPYTPKKFFELSTQGVAEGDFTMVYGFPGTTQQYLTSDAVDYVLNYSNPAKIALRTERLNVINKKKEGNPALRISYAAKQATIANAWKKWQGESLGLHRLGTIGKKNLLQSRFQAWADTNPKAGEYREVLPKLSELYSSLQPYALARDYYNEAFLAVELMNLASHILPLKPEVTQLPPTVSAYYKDYWPTVDRDIAKITLNEYVQNAPRGFVPGFLTDMVLQHGDLNGYIDWLFDNTALLTEEGAMGLLSARDENGSLPSDPAFDLFSAFNQVYREHIMPSYRQLTAQITELYRAYVRGQMEMDPERIFFPDANSTLRVAYGHVGGYKPADAVMHLPVSTLDGIIEKDNPEIYDYNIPQELRDIYAQRNYDRWEVGGTVPVCFLATNHTTGGNSGSPVLNGSGELVGINFDRTWLSTMSDIEFDPVMCRNVAVDIRYVLFVIDKIGGASYLFDEMVLK